MCVCKAPPRPPALTGVDEELVGDAGVVDIVDGGGEESRQDLQVGEHRLRQRHTQRGATPPRFAHPDI